MKKAIIWALAFMIFFVASVSAEKPTMFQCTLPNNTMTSTNPADFQQKFFCAGPFVCNQSIMCNRFDNTSASYTGGGTTTFQRSANQVNITTKTGETNVWISGLQSNYLGFGTKCDVVLCQYGNQTTPNGQVGFGDDLSYAGTDDTDLRAGWLNNNADKMVLHYAANSFSAGNFRSPRNVCVNISVVLGSSNTGNFTLNGTGSGESGVGGTHSAQANFSLEVFVNAAEAQGDKIGLNSVFCYNETSGAPLGGQYVAETVPPEITFYNMTSDGGCTNWNTNKNNPCATSDATPQVKINTSEDAFCRIGISDLNYTALGSGRECSGAGTSKHTCVLASEDEITYDLTSIYIGCEDLSSNGNISSTSGALSLNVTNLETTAKNSIELGIRNALSTGYITYTNQRIYARNSANSQKTGSFDKVAKKLNKIWAFNRIGVFESHVNMFNITPVLYTLEIANKTSTNITKEVELLINSTK